MRNLMFGSPKNVKREILLIFAATLIVSGFFISNVLALTTITVTSPVGGENWSGIQNITWKGDCGSSDKVNIYYSTDGFVASSKQITESIDCSLGLYSWDTSIASDGNNYKIRVVSSDDVLVYDTSGDITIDNTAPVITSPVDQEFEAEGFLTTSVLTPATAIDNIDPNPVITYDPDEFEVGITEVTWTATDAAGNFSTDVSNVTIVDTTPPDITLIGSDPITLEYGSIYTDDGATAFDLVDEDLLTSSIVVVNLVDASILGTYTVTYNVFDSSNNAAEEVTRTVNVVERPIIVTADVQSKIYGEADPIFDYTYSPDLVNGDSFTGALTRDAGEDVGDYAITQGSLALSDNYDLTYEGANFTIDKADVTVSAIADNKAYDGTTEATVSLTVTGAVSGDNLTVTYDSASFVDRNVGKEKIVNVTDITLISGKVTNYSFNIIATATADITQLPIEVTATTDTKVYDGNTISTGIPTISPDLVEDDTANFTQSFDDKNAGSGKTLIPSGIVEDGNDGNNYDVTFVNDTTGEIIKKALDVTATGQNKPYDGTINATVTLYDDRISGDVLDINYTNASFEDVNIGVNKVVSVSDITVTGPDSRNYVSNPTTKTTAEIKIRPIEVTADAQSKTYGESDPVLTHTYSPDLVNGDSFTGALTRDAGEDVGDYAITRGTLALSGNYTLNYTGASLTINKKTITVTADSKTKTYGESDPVLTYTYSPDLVNGDSFTGALTRDAGEDVGDHAITQDILALSGNYTLNYTRANLTINKLAITVTAVFDTKVYDGNTISTGIPTISPDLVEDDTANFTQSFDDKNVGPGKTLTSSGIVNDGNDGNNYDVTFIEDTKGEITQLPIEVTATTDTKVYDGNTISTGIPTISPDLVEDDTANFTQSFDDKNAGSGKTLTSSGIVNDGNNGNNYNVTFVSDETGEIEEKDITITPVAGQYKVYSEADPIFDYTPNPDLIGDDVFMGALDRITGEDVGAYAFTLSDLSAGSNYSLVLAPDTFEIKIRPITVTANDYTKEYGVDDPDLDYEITSGSLVGNDDFTGVLTRDAGEDVGTYAITQGTLTLSNNYTLTFVGANLTIADTREPEIAFHADITAEATSPEGAVVDYTNPTAFDLVDGDVSVTCIPASGSTFVLGDTTVNCSVTDTANNTATSSFVISVVDTILPEITNLTPPHTSVTSDATPEISVVFIENGSGINVNSIKIKVNGEDETSYADITADSVIYTPIPLSAGTYIVTVDAADMVGNSVQASWSFKVNPSTTTITASSNKESLLADGISQAKITAQILDNGESVAGKTVIFATTPLGILSDITVSDEKGEATAILTSTDVGNTTITASYNSDNGLVQATVNITFTEVISDIIPDPVATYDIPLSFGWNLISLPLIPDSTIIENVLDGINNNIDNIDVVKYFDASTGIWLSYIPGIGGTLSTMEDGKGYWIYMDKADNTLTVNGVEMSGPAEILSDYPIVAGWNLIGFKSVNSMKSSTYLSRVSYIRVYGYKENYFTVSIDRDMEPGFGYWLYADVADNIVP